MKFPAILTLAAVLAATPLFSAEAEKREAFPGMEADLARTLKEQPDFYVFKQPADLPADLKWEDGSDLPEYADPNAKKGGSFNTFIQDYPRTIRVIGPDATGGIRQYLWDFTAMYPAHAHPNFPDRVYPGLAMRWALDAANRTVYFQLNPQATWSDGEPITTADFVFSLYLYRSLHIREPWYNDFHTKTWERITVFDQHTYALTLRELRPDLLVRAAQGFFIWPRHAMADFGPDFIEKYQWRILPTTAAYVLRPQDLDRDRGRAITLHRNREWWARDNRFWRGRFNPDRYRLTVIRDLDKAFESFAKGDLDYFLPMTTVPKYWYDLLPDSHPDVTSGYIHKTIFYNQIPRPDWGIWINRSKPLLNDRNVRIGLHHASNFDKIVRDFYRGDAVVMQTRSDGYAWRTHPTLTHRAFDPAKAREYFALAGFTRPDAEGILTNERGERLAFTLTTYSPIVRDQMSILAQEARRAGVLFRLEQLDQTTGWKKVQEKNHEVALIALSRSVEMYPRYWEMYHGSNAWSDAYLDADGRPVSRAADGQPNPNPTQVRVQTNNMTMTFIPELDRLIEKYDQASTIEEVKSLAQQIEEILHADAAWVNGWAIPFYRLASWRWVRWPQGFNGMTSRNAEELFVHWIDSDMEEETRAARRAGRKFPETRQTFDQFKR